MAMRHDGHNGHLTLQVSLCLAFGSNTGSQLLPDLDQMSLQLHIWFWGTTFQEETIRFPAKRPGLK